MEVIVRENTEVKHVHWMGREGRQQPGALKESAGLPARRGTITIAQQRHAVARGRTAVLRASPTLPVKLRHSGHKPASKVCVPSCPAAFPRRDRPAATCPYRAHWAKCRCTTQEGKTAPKKKNKQRHHEIDFYYCIAIGDKYEDGQNRRRVHDARRTSDRGREVLVQSPYWRKA